jgi:hypothetical protein
MGAPNLVSLWAGFAAMCLALCGVAWVVAPWALGGGFALAPFALACAVTTALFPLVRPLYMDVSTV